MRKTFLFYASAPLVELLRLAASQQEVSRSAFIRQAIKEKAARVLSGINVAPVESANVSRGVADILVDQSGTMVILNGTAKKSPKESE